MRVDGREQRRERPTRRVHRDLRAGEEVGAVAREDPDAEDHAGPRLEDELHAPAAVADRPRLAARPDVGAPDLDVVAGGARLTLREPDRGEDRVGERRARHRAVVRLHVRRVEHVRDRVRRLVVATCVNIIPPLASPTEYTCGSDVRRWRSVTTPRDP